jgi:predicted MFS family arabinose efflux permease
LSLLVLAQGILSPAGAGAGAFSVLIGIVSARLTPDLRSTAGGIINAGGSLGQFIFAPVVQFVMRLGGYTAGLIFTALSALLMLIPAVALCRKKKEQPAAVPKLQDSSLSRSSLREQIGVAFRNPSYLLLHSGFFTCGFHVAFLTTHLPGEIGLHGQPASVSAVCLALIGLSNIAGSLGVGIAGKHFRMKYILACMYISRAAMISIYLAAPKTEINFYIFAVATGLTWLATVPPTAGIVGKLFGLRYLATLFALTMLTHQVGAFFGAWLGGLAMQQSQSLVWVWHIDVALALFAALVNLPIKEESPSQGG